jgi:hypothetical protein
LFIELLESNPSIFNALSVDTSLGLFQTGMIHIPPRETSTRNGYKKSPFSFLAGIFKRKKFQDDKSNAEVEDPSSVLNMDRSSDPHSE